VSLWWPRRAGVAISAAALGVAASAQAASFGNPDRPPQGRMNARSPTSLNDPGPRNPALAGQVPSFQDPPATDVDGMPCSGPRSLAAGIVGATIMPHTLYLHSGLTQRRTVVRNDGERRRLLRFSNQEVVLALGLAGMVNLAMVIWSASVFGKSTPGVADLGWRTRP
jgi:hypothetical protein